ncbi:ATP-binding protein [Candidatus Micrarchaeota archaeon]|nr:ATP-binding protein [Candidatus Micrarchaeota archaeon]
MHPANPFVNRLGELAFLEGLYRRPGLQVAVLYGRRRVGKTELINHFTEGKDGIYFLADKGGTQANAQRFAEACAARFEDLTPKALNFEDAFAYLGNRIAQNAAGKGKLVVVLDEFSYLVEKDSAVPSFFQRIVDQIVKGSNLLLILCGSSMSMMFRGALSYESPLYGRRTGDWLVKPMTFFEARGFYPRAPMAEAVAAYAVFGGIPAYAAKFDGRDVLRSIQDRILSKGETLYNEPEVLLREELREPPTYLSILQAMASNAKLTDIANAARVNAKDMPKYLKTLEELQLVRKINPVTERNSKKSLYFIDDNFFAFWFKFVYPHRSELEAGRIQDVLPKIGRDLNPFVGLAFEQVCAQYLSRQGEIPYNKVGKWWGHVKKEGTRVVEEIDIVTLDERTKTILLAECKWSERVNAGELVAGLAGKAAKVEWNNGKRKEHYAIFAKSFGKRTTEFEGKPVHCLDANEMVSNLRAHARKG